MQSLHTLFISKWNVLSVFFELGKFTRYVNRMIIWCCTRLAGDRDESKAPSHERGHRLCASRLWRGNTDRRCQHCHRKRRYIVVTCIYYVIYYLVFSFSSVLQLHDPFNVSKYAEIADFSEPSGVNETSVMSCAIVAKLPTAPYYYHASVKAKYGPKACWKASVYVTICILRLSPPFRTLNPKKI